MNKEYKAPDGTRIGHIHLKVSDIDKSLSFWKDLLGFSITQRYGSQAVFLSAGGYHHHIGLNTWMSKGASYPPERTTGLFHVAILYPGRRDLAIILKRLLQMNYPLEGYSDHGVSEAIYLRDPDNNGVELYWDKPQDQWPRNKDGLLEMTTLPLNTEELLRLADENSN